MLLFDRSPVCKMFVLLLFSQSYSVQSCNTRQQLEARASAEPRQSLSLVFSKINKPVWGLSLKLGTLTPFSKQSALNPFWLIDQDENRQSSSWLFTTSLILHAGTLNVPQLQQRSNQINNSKCIYFPQVRKNGILDVNVENLKRHFTPNLVLVLV